MNPEIVTLVSGVILIALIFFVAWRVRRGDRSRPTKHKKEDDIKL